MRNRRRPSRPAPQEVRVVTDSTACLPTGLPDGPVVVPLRVLVGDEAYAEGEDITPDRLAELVSEGEQVTTSQPSPEAFAAVYRALGEQGVRSVVSVHLSGALSGTVGSAGTAAARSPLQVRAVDSRTAAA
ncbi:DegV family protein, partial [Promicromonospora kroppenstedtii]|uniref:DegV family protein n=1 Tax=Promicromonospora kroppenstedtii TaxID=440482 RepID=UPI001FE195E9